jgi:hypothetical protein
MITSQDVRERLSKRPFEPFRIVTSSGQHYGIPHSDFVFVGKRTLAIGTPKFVGDKDPNGIHLISILHVTALEVIQTKLPTNELTSQG